MSLCLIIVMLCGLGGLAPAQTPETLHYQAMTIAQFDAKPVTGLPTRVELAGIVLYKAHEGDGDIHLQVCVDKSPEAMAELKPGQRTRTRCFVAEVMPDLAVPGSAEVKVGDRVTVDGISRYDGEHKCRELHPVERLRIEGRAAK
jgi:hypothetical protein